MEWRPRPRDSGRHQRLDIGARGFTLRDGLVYFDRDCTLAFEGWPQHRFGNHFQTRRVCFVDEPPLIHTSVEGVQYAPQQAVSLVDWSPVGIVQYQLSQK